jgi:hypothetical protein
MIGCRAVVGLTLLSALLLCAFAAQSASANSKSTNTTMFTCVENGKGDFTDAHCDTKGPNAGKEKFAHVAVANGSTTKIEATNVPTPGQEAVPAILKGKIGLTETQITCTTVKNNTEQSEAHNEELNMKHTITGVAQPEYTNCSVQKPAKCDVKEPIVVKASVEGGETFGASEKEMGLQFKGSGAEETFTEITYTEPECALKEKTFKVKGAAVGTGKVAAGNKHSGATLVFSPEDKMQATLKLGAEAATFTSTVTVTNAVSKTPLSLTTTT